MTILSHIQLLQTQSKISSTKAQTGPYHLTIPFCGSPSAHVRVRILIQYGRSGAHA